MIDNINDIQTLTLVNLVWYYTYEMFCKNKVNTKIGQPRQQTIILIEQLTMLMN
jgi:hypothetical protein